MALHHETIHQSMRDYNRDVAPGSECEAWQDYVADCFATFGHGPWDLFGEATEGFANHWAEVAEATSWLYDPDTGTRRE